MRTRAVIVAVAVAAFLAVVPAAAGTAGERDPNESASQTSPTSPTAERAGVGVVPAGGERSSFALTAAPGSLHSDAVEIVNGGDEPVDVVVRASDLGMSVDGSYGLQPADEAAAEAGAWVTFDGATAVEVRLAAGESVEVDFDVTVPADAEPGDHAAAIVAAPDDELAVGSVLVRQRSAIRLLVRVSGELAPGLMIEDMQVDYVGAFDPSLGRATATFALHNTGNIGLIATPTLHFSQLAGTWTRRVTKDPTALILPGASVTLMVEMDGVPAMGVVDAEAVIVTAVAPGATEPDALPEPSASASAPAVPWTIVIGIGILTLAIALSVTVTRRRAAIAEQRIEERVRGELAREGSRAGAG